MSHDWIDAGQRKADWSHRVSNECNYSHLPIHSNRTTHVCMVWGGSKELELYILRGEGIDSDSLSKRWGPYLQTGQWGFEIEVTPNVISFCLLLVRVQGLFPMDNLWTSPWAISPPPQYMDPTFILPLKHPPYLRIWNPPPKFCSSCSSNARPKRSRDKKCGKPLHPVFHRCTVDINPH